MDRTTAGPAECPPQAVCAKKRRLRLVESSPLSLLASLTRTRTVCVPRRRARSRPSASAGARFKRKFCLFVTGAAAGADAGAGAGAGCCLREPLLPGTTASPPSIVRRQQHNGAAVGAATGNSRHCAVETRRRAHRRLSAPVPSLVRAVGFRPAESPLQAASAGNNGKVSLQLSASNSRKFAVALPCPHPLLSGLRASGPPKEGARFGPGRFDRTALPRPAQRPLQGHGRSRQQATAAAPPSRASAVQPRRAEHGMLWAPSARLRGGIAGAEACDGLRENTADRGSRSRQQVTAAASRQRQRSRRRAQLCRLRRRTVGPRRSRQQRKVTVTAAGHGSSSSVRPCSDSGGFQPGRQATQQGAGLPKPLYALKPLFTLYSRSPCLRRWLRAGPRRPTERPGQRSEREGGARRGGGGGGQFYWEGDQRARVILRVRSPDPWACIGQVANQKADLPANDGPSAARLGAAAAGGPALGGHGQPPAAAAAAKPCPVKPCLFTGASRCKSQGGRRWTGSPRENLHRFARQ